MDDFEVVGRIVVDSSGAAALQSVNSELDGMSTRTGLLSSVTNAFGSVAHFVWANLVLQGVTMATQAIGNFMSSIITEGEKAQDTQAQLAAVIQSTGDVSGVTAEQVNQLANSFALTTKFSDDTVVGAQNILLTFTNIGKDTFPLATQSVLDFATAMHLDANQAALQLGKALNDPILGVTALRREGVQLSDAQKEQIKQFMAVNDVAGAQAIILKEVQKEFGGSAEAAGKTFAGQMAILNNQLDMVKEGLFTMLATSPLVQEFFNTMSVALQNVLTFLNELSVGRGLSALSALGFSPETIAFIQQTTEAGTKFISGVLNFFAQWWSSNGPVITANANNLFGALQKAFAQLAPQVMSFLSGALNQFEIWFTKNGPLIQEVIFKISDAFINRIIPAAVEMWGAVEPVLSALLNIILDGITLAMDVMVGNWGDAWQQVVNILQSAWSGISGFIMGAAAALVTYFGGVPNNIGAVWSANFGQLWNIIKVLFTNALNQVRATLSDWIQLGADLINGISQGIANAAASLVNSVAGAVNGAINTAKSIAGIASPSRVFAEMGQNMMLGLAQGIGDGVKIPVTAIGKAIPALVNAGGSALSSTVNNNSNQHFYNYGTIVMGGAAGDQPTDVLNIFRK